MILLYHLGLVVDVNSCGHSIQMVRGVLEFNIDPLCKGQDVLNVPGDPEIWSYAPFPRMAVDLDLSVPVEGMAEGLSDDVASWHDNLSTCHSEGPVGP